MHLSPSHPVSSRRVAFAVAAVIAPVSIAATIPFLATPLAIGGALALSVACAVCSIAAILALWGEARFGERSLVVQMRSTVRVESQPDGLRKLLIDRAREQDGLRQQGDEAQQLLLGRDAALRSLLDAMLSNADLLLEPEDRRGNRLRWIQSLRGSGAQVLELLAADTLAGQTQPCRVNPFASSTASPDLRTPRMVDTLRDFSLRG